MDKKPDYISVHGTAYDSIVIGICKYLYKHLDESRELIFNKITRTISVPTLDDNKVSKVSKNGTIAKNGHSYHTITVQVGLERDDLVSKWEYELGDLSITLIRKIE